MIDALLRIHALRPDLLTYERLKESDTDYFEGQMQGRPSTNLMRFGRLDPARVLWWVLDVARREGFEMFVSLDRYFTDREQKELGWRFEANFDHITENAGAWECHPSCPATAAVTALAEALEARHETQ